MVLDQDLGRLRTTPFSICGASSNPQFPIESQIKEELNAILLFLLCISSVDK